MPHEGLIQPRGCVVTARVMMSVERGQVYFGKSHTPVLISPLDETHSWLLLAWPLPSRWPWAVKTTYCFAWLWGHICSSPRQSPKPRQDPGPRHKSLLAAVELCSIMFHYSMFKCSFSSRSRRNWTFKWYLILHSPSMEIHLLYSRAAARLGFHYCLHIWSYIG